MDMDYCIYILYYFVIELWKDYLFTVSGLLYGSTNAPVWNFTLLEIFLGILEFI